MNHLSVAITSYESSRFIRPLIDKIVDIDQIDDIIIVDDGSTDYDQLEKLVMDLKCDKISLMKNSSNIGALKNKYTAVSFCKNEFVSLIDSDNTIDESYIRSIDFTSDALQMPSFAKPSFDYRSIIGNYSLEGVKELLSSDNTCNKTMMCLNTGNFTFQKDRYLDIMKNNLDYPAHAACSMYPTYLWLKSGGIIKIVDSMEYEHTTRYDSYWMKNSHTSEIVVTELRDLILKN